MESYFNFFKKIKNQTGVSAVIVAIVLTMLIGITALAVDVGYMYVTKNELQNVADAAALAGAGYLGSVYETLSYDEQQTHVFSRSDIVDAVQQVALKNQADRINIFINDSDIIIGTWNSATSTLTPMADPLVGPDAVRVISRRDTIANDPISTSFGSIFRDTVNVNADATAALTGPAIVEEGELKVPFGLSENNFPNNCTDPINFSPTTSSCAGWHNFFDSVNANDMSAKLLGLIQGDVEDYTDLGLVNGPDWLAANFDMNAPPDPEVTPQVGTTDEFEFTGGTVSSLFLGGRLGNTANDINLPEEIIGDEKHPAPFPALFDYFRRRDDDGNDSIWTSTVPIYEDDDVCVNPNGAIPIIGFATIEIHMPNPPPDSSVSVYVYCEINFVDGRGGGGSFGNLKGTIPNLVE